MPATVPNVSENAFLDVIFSAARQPRLRLFSNNLIPDASTLLANLTESGFGGYAAIDLSIMAAAMTNASGQAQKSLANCTFTCTGAPVGVPVYGWYVTFLNAAGAVELLELKRFDAMKTITAVGDYVKFDFFAFGQEV